MEKNKNAGNPAVTEAPAAKGFLANMKERATKIEEGKKANSEIADDMANFMEAAQTLHQQKLVPIEATLYGMHLHQKALSGHGYVEEGEEDFKITIEMNSKNLASMKDFIYRINKDKFGEMKLTDRTVKLELTKADMEYLGRAKAANLNPIVGNICQLMKDVAKMKMKEVRKFEKGNLPMEKLPLEFQAL